MTVDPQAELEASRSLVALMEAAERCREAYARANMALPEPLQRYFGLDRRASEAKKEKPGFAVPAPEREPPPGSAPEWISIPAEHASPPSVVLTVLRQGGGGPIRAGLLVEKVKAIVQTTEGTLANAGTRLQSEGLIERGPDGWRLLNTTKAPVLFKDRLWGPADIFGKYELAAHRREAILYLLGLLGGLQTGQIIEHLRKCPWLRAPVNKEVVQDDVEVLAKENKIRRVSHSKKWILATAKEGT